MKRRQLLTSVAATGLTAAAIHFTQTKGMTQNPIQSSVQSSRAVPFTIGVEQTKLDQIRQRVQAYPWHQAPIDAGWNYGVDQAYMKQLVAYWLNQYDWRKHEQAMNRFNHYTAQVDKQTVHFIYEPGSGKNPKPLLLLHGWPYSFYGYSQHTCKLRHDINFCKFFG